MADIPIILLAAGASKRMRHAKPLLMWGNEFLIQNRITELQGTGQEIVVVLGAQSGKIIPEIRDLDIQIVLNKKWKNGIGSSISKGVQFVKQNFPNAEGTLISQVDQALVSGEHFKKMIAVFRLEQEEIVVSKSSTGYLGVPVIFSRKYFDLLSQLNGDHGAKRVFLKHPDHVYYLYTDENLSDLDTKEEYEYFIKQLFHSQKRN